MWATVKSHGRVIRALLAGALTLSGSVLGFVPPAGTTTALIDSSLVHRRHEGRGEREGKQTSLGAKRVATFGMGCFWAPAETMLNTPGVLDTVSGYTGRPNYDGRPPKYDDVCFGREWVEAVRVTYDDNVLSYREVLDSFFEAQEPRYGSRQYASIVFVADEGQRAEAEEWLGRGREEEKTRERDGLPVGMTAIEDASRFYAAEGYHQKYWEKWRVRLGSAVALLAVASGALGPILPDNDPDLAQRVETLANGVFVVGGILALLERQLDAKVVEIQ